MKTLREIGTFVGIPRGALAAARYSGSLQITLKDVASLVTKGSRPASMRALIDTLQNLTPITLDADLPERSGQEPFQVKVHLNAAGGITWFTSVAITASGRFITEKDIPSTSAGEFELTQLGLGVFEVSVHRVGISNDGFVSLSKALGEITVSRRPSAPPAQPATSPPTPPSISVRSNGDGSFAVSGKGFVPGNATVNILVGDGTFNQNPLVFTVSAEDGELKQFPTGKICQRQGSIFFEASDGRIVDGKQLFSNTVQLSCPF